ncbi:hypothetical protein ARMSODRAFT_1019383 [Armillaria solidipes]|uniref:Uncharacterized protein n=1 Tax=Armillaria solidipes TaxID=1076256 RepID=A0A2H3BD59_9AGAR|nr:hypothetical protein ARMSODRAFT_1019383 [Armillaria solidipes]
MLSADSETCVSIIGMLNGKERVDVCRSNKMALASKATYLDFVGPAKRQHIGFSIVGYGKTISAGRKRLHSPLNDDTITPCPPSLSFDDTEPLDTSIPSPFTHSMDTPSNPAPRQYRPAHPHSLRDEPGA